MINENRIDVIEYNRMLIDDYILKKILFTVKVQLNNIQ